MTAQEPTASAKHQLFTLADGAAIGVKLKSPRLIIGPLELGLKGTLDVLEADEKGQLKKVSSTTFRPSLSIKDVFFRGRIELPLQLGGEGEGANRWKPTWTNQVSYSKKIRLPFLNTELWRLQVTAALPGSAKEAGGLLGRGLLGLRISSAAEPLHSKTIVRSPPDYSLELRPRLGLPQSLYDRAGFPGSVYLKADAVLHVTDSEASLKGVKPQLTLRRLDGVVRLQRRRGGDDDAEAVGGSSGGGAVVPYKPGRVVRNVLHAARRLTVEDAQAEEEARHVRAAVKVARVLEAEAPPQPDAIDRAAAKAREWAHAILVNSCVATKHLQETAAVTGERLKRAVGMGGSAAAAPAEAITEKKSR
ncbi:hypothetical protein HYH02_002088 [Chlamydomonas schloesseri]|uniref:Uncharacterized protein n=1 Tax=Chlamydomonas schloesseri TaxID=2026947 RepID=A0A835WTV2_9CHLO|nr:hypothetical protein HYH02_002088 [Chlamydomonas schloesseri]|eukprot:KAG2453882.1 hypothetical protein HYH02_002088 [Chlamydomonas schloesseri]